MPATAKRLDLPGAIAELERRLVGKYPLVELHEQVARDIVGWLRELAAIRQGDGEHERHLGEAGR